VTSPSARDRAIEIVAVAIATVNAEHMTGSELYSPPATAAVDALLASPGVLAALAGERETDLAEALRHLEVVTETLDRTRVAAVAVIDEIDRIGDVGEDAPVVGRLRDALSAPVGGVDTPTEPTANEPEHEALTRALAAAGWARVGGRVGHYDRLRNDSLPEVTVIVPTDPAAPDYRELLDAARASTRLPVHPGVMELLERCDVEDRVAGEYGWIQTTEVRALLTEGDHK
jgi:hypothetical protein